MLVSQRELFMMLVLAVLAQVTSVLHRQKIMRAMQRQMLGLGAEPGPIKHLTCSSSSSSAAGAQLSASAGRHIVQCIWQAPQTPGEPPLHKYVLERFALAPASPAAAWQPVAELDDLVVTRFGDAVAEPGSYQYRAAAWNLYGRSAYALSDEVLVQGFETSGSAAAAAAAAGPLVAGVPAAVAAHHQQQRIEHQVQQELQTHQQQQAVQTQHTSNAAGEVSSLESDKNEAAIESSTTLMSQPVGKQQQQQQQQQQLLPKQQLRLPAHVASPGADQSQRQQQQQHAAADTSHHSLPEEALRLVSMHHRSQYQQEQQSHSQELYHNHHPQQQQQTGEESLPDGLVRHMGACSSSSSSSSSRLACYGSSTCVSGDSSTAAHADGADPAAAGCRSNTLVVPNSCAAREPAAAGPHLTAGSNIVWVVGDRSALAGHSASSSPAAMGAQAQLLASMQAAAGAAAGVSSQQAQGSSSSNRGNAAGTAGKAAAAGSWSFAAFIASYVGRWLRALLNSLLLLVVPVCVRLLPVPVLHQLALGLARALQLLPQPVQRVLQQLGATQPPDSSDAESAQHLTAGTDAISSSADGLVPGNRALKASASGSSNGSSSRMRTSSSTGAAAAYLAGIPIAPAAAAGSSAMGMPLLLPAQVEQQQLQQAGLLLTGDGGLSANVSSPGGAAAAAIAGGGALKNSSSQLGLLLRSAPSSRGSSSTALPAAASPVPASNEAAAAANAVPYAGMYGFAWQGSAIPAAATAGAPLQQVDVQAVFAALAPDADIQQQQEQQLTRLQHVKSQGQLAAAAAAAAAEGCCNAGQCSVGSPEQAMLLAGGLPNKKRCAYPG
jgi:hypothetical protein